MPASISRRLSIRWLPNEATEPTHTIVLTGSRTGCFLDVRFMKSSSQLDWAFAGYRLAGLNSATFKHYIDSRTLKPLDIEDRGTNTTLPDGTTLEAGEMINPQTGKMTAYEEIWQEEEIEKGLFIKNIAGSAWRAHVGDWQMGLGREDNNTFWAWQAQREGDGGEWVVKFSTESVTTVRYLPEGEEVGLWMEGDTVEWEGDNWTVLEHPM